MTNQHPKILSILLFLYLFLAPIFFLPFTQEYTEINKFLLLTILVIALLLTYSINLIRNRTITIYKTAIDIPLIAFFIFSLASTIVIAEYKMGALLSVNGPYSIGLLALMYLLLVQLGKNIPKSQILTPLIAGACVLSVISIMATSGLLGQFFENDEILNNTSFSPSGSVYIGLLYLVAIALTASTVLISKKNAITSSSKNKTITIAATLLILAGCTVGTFYLHQTGLILLPLKAGLEILLTTWSRVHHLLFGIGPGNFFTAFSLARPIWLNQDFLWNVTFLSSTTYLLTLATEVGISGAGSFIFIILLTTIKVVKELRKETALIVCFAALAIIHICAPSNIFLLSILILVIGVIIPKHEIKKIEISGRKNLILIVPALLIVLSVIIAYGFGRVYAAEILFKQAIVSIEKNNGQEAYTKHVQAIRLNKYVDKYHRTFSQINLALVNSLSAKKNLSNEDKQRIPRLIQQAIDETSFTISLSPTNPENWLNRGNVYSAISKTISGSEKFAETAYKNASIVSPTDPSIRFRLGIFYLDIGKYDDAVKSLKDSVKLKPDWANAHYNLSIAYKQNKDLQNAQKELKQTLVLLPQNSVNRQKVQDELNVIIGEIKE